MKPSKIKAFRVLMQKEKQLSNRTINTACDTLRIMTDWMIADQILTHDPFLSVKRFEVEKRTRRGFTIDEACAIFDASWSSELARLFNLTAAITGMRLSEIRAILGHSEGKGTMTAIYTDWTPSMFTQAYIAQEKLYSILAK